MTQPEIRFDLPVDEAREVAEANAYLEGLSAEQRIEWALTNLPGRHLLSSSFGIQAAVMLHLVNRAQPGIPVVLVDTGHLFSETYRFIDELTERLDLNLQIVRSDLSSAWQEARFGRLWEQGADGIARYNRINKEDTRFFGLKRECGLHE